MGDTIIDNYLHELFGIADGTKEAVSIYNNAATIFSGLITASHEKCGPIKDEKKKKKCFKTEHIKACEIGIKVIRSNRPKCKEKPKCLKMLDLYEQNYKNTIMKINTSSAYN